VKLFAGLIGLKRGYATTAVVAVAVVIAHEDLFVLLAILLLLEVTADSWRFSNWENACELYIA